MEEEKLSIKINVADRYYPLKIAITDEEKIRLAARRINEKVALYRQRYADRDLHDALSMASLQFVIKLIELEEKQNVAPVLQELVDLDKQMEEYLQQIGA
jgi:cell division protein ZapA